MTDDESLDAPPYHNPIGKPVKELTDAEVAEWIRTLEVDVAEGLTPWNMNEDVIARAVSAETARSVGPEEMEWRRAHPEKVWLKELLNLHRLRHMRPGLWNKIRRWD